MKLSEIIEKIEKYAPPSLAQFDYEGLLMGNPDQEIKKMSIALDGTLLAIRRAIANDSELLIVHHGLAINEKHCSSLDLEKLGMITRSNLAVYRAHLNLDFCKDGIIDNLCKIIGLDASPVNLWYEDKIIHGGVYVSDNNKISLSNLVAKIKSKLNPPTIRIMGKKRNRYERIAVAAGGGAQAGFIPQLKADAFIVGQASHSGMREAEDCECTLIELTHYSSENKPLKICAEIISRMFQSEVEVDFIHLPESTTAY